MKSSLTDSPQLTLTDAMTVIEIRPHRWGWKAFEAPGVEPVFLNQQDAIDYATESRVLSLWRDSRSGFNRQRSVSLNRMMRATKIVIKADPREARSAHTGFRARQ